MQIQTLWTGFRFMTSWFLTNAISWFLKNYLIGKWWAIMAGIWPLKNNAIILNVYLGYHSQKMNSSSEPEPGNLR